MNNTISRLAMQKGSNQKKLTKAVLISVSPQNSTSSSLSAPHHSRCRSTGLSKTYCKDRSPLCVLDQTKGYRDDPSFYNGRMQKGLPHQKYDLMRQSFLFSL